MKALLRVLTFTFLGFGFILLKPDLFPPRDFVEYWSAAKVLTEGGNPYDGEDLLKVQRIAKEKPNEEKAVSLWTPPFTLPLYLPFAWMPFDTAHLTWLFVQLLCFGVSIELICRSYDLKSSIGYLALTLFSPVFWNLHFGQNTAFISLGLTGFLRFRETMPKLTGLFVALTAIKPHLLAPFGVVLILDSVTRSGRRVLLAGIAVLLVASAVPLAFDPQIFSQFTDALQKPSTPETVRLADWQVPLWSYHLRQAIDPNQFWIQFIPCLAGIGISIAYCFAKEKSWQWKHELPRLVLLSLLVTPYGGWIFDLTLLLVPVLAGLNLVLCKRDLLVGMIDIALILSLSFMALTIEGLAKPWWFTPGIFVVYLGAEIATSVRAQFRP